MPETIEFSDFHLENEFQLYITSDHYKQTQFSKIEDADNSKTP